MSGADAYLYPNVDWYDEVLKSYAPAQRYNASVRGGTKRMRYYASLEYYNQGSLIKNLALIPMVTLRAWVIIVMLSVPTPTSS